MNPTITIAIPAYNNEKVIGAAIESAQAQSYPLKEILVIDDCSTDNTVKVAESFKGVRVIKNETNLGIGKNIVRLMEEAKGKYILYLCADDIFANTAVAGDVVNQFNKGDTSIGVIGRYFYFFRDGYPGAIGVCRDKNILTQSCCPSGMAFRVMKGIIPSNRIFIEMPFIVVQYLKKYRWTMLEYDTVAARFHPGGNTGTKKSYYVESPWQNWVDLTGDKNWEDFPSFIMLKNRAPHRLWGEICIAVKLKKSVLLKAKFWLYAVVAVLVPGIILRQLTNFYRHRIGRLSAKIIERGK